MRDFSKNTRTYEYCIDGGAVRKKLAQYQKKQIQPPGTTFSNFSDKIAVPREHNLFFHVSNIYTKRMLGREKAVIHVLFKGNALSK